ncbi:MAG: magnesium-translocating P-type ATPase [Usitatibacter sp.]
MRDEARAEPLVQGEATPLGLTSAQARGLIHQFGPNELRPKRPLSFAAELGRRLRNPLVAILLAASLVSAFTGDIASFVIILVIVVLSVAIDFVQEHRASRAAQALVHRVLVHALVMRDGRLAPIPVARLVPGDVVQLSPGSLVPADGRLLESNALHVNESMLTGEPFPVEKGAAGPGGASELFMGTSAVSGSGTMLVTRTGPSTEIGKIALSLAAVAPPTSFERGIHAFGMLIMRLTAFMVLFVLLVNAALHRPLLESFLFAIALAVGLTPELLPMIVSVTLARGALRLADEHVIVKRLGAIEGLGSMDVLCTDKTGTLTRAHIRLESHIDGDGRDSPRVLELAYLNSHFAAGVRNPLDAAILERPALDPGRWKKLAEIPFDFERRRVAVVLESAGERMLVVKGAPEDLLKLSTRYETAGDKTAREWTPDARARAVRSLEALGESGLRALGVAYKPLQGGAGRAADEQDLVFVGFAAFIDPPKPQAAAALAALAASGIRLKILTGDGEAVTRHLCAQIGLEVDGALTGEQIERMDDPALAARVEAATIFCRVTPAQKNRIVLMLKARGHVTGFLGDGINDATALHSADVSLSVNNAVDVAKEAADLILLRRDLGVVHRGVLEGRRTFANIRKYLLMGTSSNFGNMFSMAGAAIFLPFLPMLPAQILLNNLLYDFSEIPIPLDHADAAETARPQKWDMVLVRDFMWTLGPVSSLFDFLTFYVLIALLQADEALFQTGWFIESLATQVLVIFVIRTRASPFASRPALTLVATSLAVVAIAVALPYTPAAAYLGFEPPPAHFFTVLAGLTLAYLALAELVKRRFYAARS